VAVHLALPAVSFPRQVNLLPACTIPIPSQQKGLSRVFMQIKL